MSRWVVEFTSARPHEPQQVEVEAGDPAEAIAEALNGFGPAMEDLADCEDPQYAGWRHWTISVGPAPKDEE